MPRVNIGKSPELRAREKDLRSRYGGFMNLSEVTRELGCRSRTTAEKAVKSIPHYIMTGKKMYDITDIARLIEDSRVPAGRGT